MKVLLRELLFLGQLHSVFRSHHLVRESLQRVLRDGSVVRENQVWLARGVAGSLLVAGAAWTVIRRRKKPAS